MNYENQALNEIQAKIDALQKLLDEAKANLEDKAIQDKFAFSFENLEKALKLEIKNANEQSKESLQNQISLDVKQNTSELFALSKDEILKSISAQIDTGALSLDMAKQFLKENEKNLQSVVGEELQKQDFQSIINAHKIKLDESLQEELNEGKKATAKLERELGLINLNYKRLVDEKSERALKEYINEHKASIFKPFSLNFLKDDILQDRDLKRYYKVIAAESIKDKLNEDGLKEEISESLLNLNKEVSDEFFNSAYYNEQRFLQNLVLTSLSTINELKVFNLTLNELERLAQGEDIDKQNIYKVI